MDNIASSLQIAQENDINSNDCLKLNRVSGSLLGGQEQALWAGQVTAQGKKKK